MTAAPPRLAGYDLEALVGQGGMAEVYRARAREGPLAGRTVAVKRLRPALARDPEYVELFLRETAVTRRLHHPAVVEVLDAGVEGGTPYLVMDYVDGKNLRQVLSQCAARTILLPPDFAVYVGHVLAAALDHAHAGLDREGRPLGLVHCDVSPSNVFISRLGEIKLGDFGVALTPGAAKGRAAGAFGKIRYLAPEQLRGEPVTPRTDLFALGAVLFELLTDAPAFPGATVDEVGQRVLAGALRAPSELRPELPFALDAVTLRCLAARPEDRWESAAALAEELGRHYDPAIGTPLAIAAVVR
ncbi:MAG TPA: serine/threonine-protein kinase, partial [Anaeromyxobacteraceae bacterium]|nr:serine/threonine-protein kinase [Anaeromyxobacteraceae bacterium]